jgi:hypothetical protein
MWEFRVLVMEPAQLEQALNDLGAKEWDLISTETLVQGVALVTVCVLRRERV